jgi:hypothetical protein
VPEKCYADLLNDILRVFLGQASRGIDINAEKLGSAILKERVLRVWVAGAKTIYKVIAIENLFTHKRQCFLQSKVCGLCVFQS